eukprot:CAMPEP_0179008316 /NCGR_PEP_ID=MMETSP0795-20121207/15640_1 /TAXON_ID=88552 /ORGANISM="Amoebophrya sp., Strain Ameob2" /LENGTH=516 /DNA_ID=CAMNT_0020703371 /DNA_START=65 /DNA_END=1615 /DNA_ORIENTATION=-
MTARSSAGTHSDSRTLHAVSPNGCAAWGACRGRRCLTLKRPPARLPVYAASNTSMFVPKNYTRTPPIMLSAQQLLSSDSPRAAARPLPKISLFLLLRMLFLSLSATLGADPIMKDDGLTVSNATWHRAQLGNIDFESSCSFNPNLKNGCLRENRFDFELGDDVGLAVGSTSGTGAAAGSKLFQTEKEALIRFFVVMQGFQWREATNWNVLYKEECDFTNTCVDIYYTNPGNSPCWDQWYGITCNEAGKVIEINLVDNRLNGTFTGDAAFPDDAQLLNQFTALRRINLGTTRARYHNLPNPNANNVSGVWPSMDKCRNLTAVELSGNRLTDLPDLYRNGDTLKTLAASHNRIRRFPQGLIGFAALETLDLSHNQINELFPVTFGKNMRQIRFVNLDNNAIFGMVTEALDMADMQKTLVFSIAHNPLLSGIFPIDVVKNAWVENDYVSILNTTMYGEFAGLCLDVPFCWRYMYNTHADQTWAGTLDPQIQVVLEKAMTGGTTSTTTTTFDFFAAGALR